jgi:hypothetical protein
MREKVKDTSLYSNLSTLREIISPSYIMAEQMTIVIYLVNAGHSGDLEHVFASRMDVCESISSVLLIILVKSPSSFAPFSLKTCD